MTGWVPIKLAAEVTGRPYRTLQAWAYRHKVRSACRVHSRELLVWWPDIHDRSAP